MLVPPAAPHASVELRIQRATITALSVRFTYKGLWQTQPAAASLVLPILHSVVCKPLFAALAPHVH